MTDSIVFVHGSGQRSGRANWPLQTDAFPDASYLVMPGYGEEPPRVTNMREWVSRLLAACDQPTVIVAHSFGAIAAVLAAEQGPDLIRGLVLLEPALYSIARGQASVDAHVARMSPMFDGAADGELADFWVKFISALSGAPGRVPNNETERRDAERVRLLRPPWEFEIPPLLFAQVPTLVITGEWNQEYEEIAHVLRTLGAHHEIVRGHGHRVQDDPATNDLLTAFLAGQDDTGGDRHEDETTLE